MKRLVKGRKHDSEIKKKRYKCRRENCEIEFSSASNRKRHEKKSCKGGNIRKETKKQYLCLLCKTKFVNNYTLKRHSMYSCKGGNKSNHQDTCRWPTLPGASQVIVRKISDSWLWNFLNQFITTFWGRFQRFQENVFGWDSEVFFSFKKRLRFQKSFNPCIHLSKIARVMILRGRRKVVGLRYFCFLCVLLPCIHISE